jgi:hypothetical protein
MKFDLNKENHDIRNLSPWEKPDVDHATIWHLMNGFVLGLIQPSPLVDFENVSFEGLEIVISKVSSRCYEPFMNKVMDMRALNLGKQIAIGLNTTGNWDLSYDQLVDLISVRFEQLLEEDLDVHNTKTQIKNAIVENKQYYPVIRDLIKIRRGLSPLTNLIPTLQALPGQP